MKIENLYKYAFANSYKTWDERHAKMIVAAVGEYADMLTRDDNTNVIGINYDEKSRKSCRLYQGKCSKCKTEINSKFDFCPHCGRPISWEKAIKGIEGKSTVGGHQKKGEKNNGK